MERGANTFPFHNHLPYPESNEGLFLFFSPSLNWIKEKSVATLAIHSICDQMQNKISQFSHCVTELATLSGRHPKREDTLRILDHFTAFCLTCTLYLKGCLGIILVGDPTPGSRFP